MGVRREFLAALAVAIAATGGASLQAQQYVEEGGVRYQVTRQEISKPVAVQGTREQQVTQYRQQITTENVQHQQVYHVPVTQYQVVSRLHNRWNPFAEPYWTHHYEPVTTWQQQVGTVQIPVNKVAWVPETRTVQQPTTIWQNQTQVVETRTPIGMTPTGAGNTAMASTPSASGAPSAALSAVAPGTAPPATSVATRPLGGEMLPSGPPRYGTAPAASSGWSQQSPATQPAATAPAAAPAPTSRY